MKRPRVTLPTGPHRFDKKEADLLTSLGRLEIEREDETSTLFRWERGGGAVKCWVLADPVYFGPDPVSILGWVVGWFWFQLLMN